MLIGGAEETEPGGEILERFVDLAGGDGARIGVVPTASEDAKESGEANADLFRLMGARGADWLRIERRADAGSEDVLDLLRGVTGIFISGEDRTRLVQLVAGTAAIECIGMRNAEGGPTGFGRRSTAAMMAPLAA